MSWTFNRTEISPEDALEAVNVDPFIPPDVKGVLTKLLEFHRDKGSQKLNVSTNGHFPYMAAEQPTTGSRHTAHIEVIVTLGKDT